MMRSSKVNFVSGIDTGVGKTVARGKARLRVAISSEHSCATLSAAAEAIGRIAASPTFQGR